MGELWRSFALYLDLYQKIPYIQTSRGEVCVVMEQVFADLEQVQVYKDLHLDHHYISVLVQMKFHALQKAMMSRRSSW